MREDWRPVCSMPEEIREERRGPFKVFRVRCGWMKDNDYVSETYHIKDPEGKILKSFNDISEASVFAGEQYGKYLDELDKKKENE